MRQVLRSGSSMSKRPAAVAAAASATKAAVSSPTPSHLAPYVAGVKTLPPPARTAACTDAVVTARSSLVPTGAVGVMWLSTSVRPTVTCCAPASGTDSVRATSTARKRRMASLPDHADDQGGGGLLHRAETI